MEKPSGHGLAPVLVAIVGRTHGRRIIHETLLKRNQDLGDIARGGPLPRDQRDRASQRTAPACPDQGSSCDGATYARSAAMRMAFADFLRCWPRTITSQPKGALRHTFLEGKPAQV